MQPLKTVGVKELKRNLSAYLREVKRGVRIFVTDRDTIVAELHEPLLQSLGADSPHPIWLEWLAENVIHPPKREKGKVGVSPVNLPEGTAMRMLEEDRGE